MEKKSKVDNCNCNKLNLRQNYGGVFIMELDKKINPSLSILHIKQRQGYGIITFNQLKPIGQICLA